MGMQGMLVVRIEKDYACESFVYNVYPHHIPFVNFFHFVLVFLRGSFFSSYWVSCLDYIICRCISPSMQSFLFTTSIFLFFCR